MMAGSVERNAEEAAGGGGGDGVRREGMREVMRVEVVERGGEGARGVGGVAVD